MAMVTLILVLGACGGSKEPAVAAETTIGSVSTERGSDPIVEDVVALREAPTMNRPLKPCGTYTPC
jgi:hypothetical protein